MSDKKVENMIDVWHGDCLDILREMPDCSVDAIVTDPPYGLSNTKPAQVADVLKAWATGDDNVVPEGKGFMGAAWDGFVPPPAVWKECMRVLKPGGHMAVFAGARTQDLMGMSIRLAGFEIRDGMGWIFGSGMPKSHDIGKAIDKAAGAEREVVGLRVYGEGQAFTGSAKGGRAAGHMGRVVERGPSLETAPATSDAVRWDGWGTSLKPAIEPIILARKSLDGTVAGNVLAYGVGGLNINASRVSTEETLSYGNRTIGTDSGVYGKQVPKGEGEQNPAGRFPANVLLDERAAQEMDEQSGVTGANLRIGARTPKGSGVYGEYEGQATALKDHGDSGGASRFFPVFKYQAKAPKKERPVIEREDGTKIQHPTVKPLTLLEWLVTLITPPGGVVLDPFAGSGTTLEAARNKGFSCIGIEREVDYVQLIHKRLENTSEES